MSLHINRLRGFVIFSHRVPHRWISVRIAHGMAEYSNRYARFAMELCRHGYAVYINDHLGHGSSVANADELGFFGDDGPNSLVEDMKQLTDIARQEYPNVPVFLFGHSMGSFLARKYTAKYGHQLDGAVFCGTSGPNPAVGIGIMLSDYIVKHEGKLHRSAFLDNMAFGTYNKKTAKSTKFDWLSRDEKEVEKYIHDENCGFLFTAAGFKTLFSVLKEVSAKLWYKTVPERLQILLIAGDKDPVGEYGKGVTEVYETLRKTGHTNTVMKLYPEARHELLNELNRDEVTEDVITGRVGGIPRRPECRRRTRRLRYCHISQSKQAKSVIVVNPANLAVSRFFPLIFGCKKSKIYG